jgi:predicted patatin/cPLA2 family phospholipase
MKDIILIAGGGALRGVFGAGVLTAFQEQNIHKQVHSVYGISAGAHNGAYFITNQINVCSTVYFEELTQNKFVRLNKINIFIKSLFKKKHYDLVNIAYLEKIERTKKRLDLKKLKSSDIKFKVCVYNLNKQIHEFINGKTNPIKRINTSGGSQPFFTKKIKIGKYDYIDGDTIANYDYIKKIIQKYPNKKIILILNFKENYAHKIKTLPYELLKTLLIWRLYGFKTFKKSLKSLVCAMPYKYLKKQENVHIIECKKNVNVLNTEKEQLFQVYQEGKNQGKEFFQNQLL